MQTYYTLLENILYIIQHIISNTYYKYYTLLENILNIIQHIISNTYYKYYTPLHNILYTNTYKTLIIHSYAICYMHIQHILSFI